VDQLLRLPIWALVAKNFSHSSVWRSHTYRTSTRHGASISCPTTFSSHVPSSRDGHLNCFSLGFSAGCSSSAGVARMLQAAQPPLPRCVFSAHEARARERRARPAHLLTCRFTIFIIPTFALYPLSDPIFLSAVFRIPPSTSTNTVKMPLGINNPLPSSMKSELPDYATTPWSHSRIRG